MMVVPGLRVFGAHPTLLLHQFAACVAFASFLLFWYCVTIAQPGGPLKMVVLVHGQARTIVLAADADVRKARMDNTQPGDSEDSRPVVGDELSAHKCSELSAEVS